MNVQKEIRKLARDLLMRHPLRRGPYVFDEHELRRVAGFFGSLTKEQQKAALDHRGEDC